MKISSGGNSLVLGFGLNSLSQKHTFSPQTRELVEKAAIIDLLDDRDLQAMDAKLRALGY